MFRPPLTSKASRDGDERATRWDARVDEARAALDDAFAISDDEDDRGRPRTISNEGNGLDGKMKEVDECGGKNDLKGGAGAGAGEDARRAEASASERASARANDDVADDDEGGRRTSNADKGDARSLEARGRGKRRGEAAAREDATKRATSATEVAKSAEAIVFKVPGQKHATLKEEEEIVFKVPSARAPRMAASAAEERGGGLAAGETLEGTRRGKDEALEELSPMEEFDLEEDDISVSLVEHSPEMETAEEEEAQRDVARALVTLEKLKQETEEMVLSSTELLLKTIQSTNDYFLLFNPKLMLELRKHKAEASRILDAYRDRSVVMNSAG